MGDAATKSTIHIRWMIRRDMESVLAIEESSQEFHWLEEEFLHHLRQRNCTGMLAELRGETVGYMIYELHKNRLGLLKFVVDPRYRMLGVGFAMMETLIGKLSSDRRNRITLEVRETNLAAQKFLRRMGFRAISVLRNHYEQTAEDAYVMQYRFFDDWCGD